MAAAARIALAQQQPERKWYGGRAAAESVKTLAWRFAVCGQAFDRSLTEREAVGAFADRIFELTRELRSLDRPAGADPQMTDGMKRLQGLKLEDRRAA